MEGASGEVISVRSAEFEGPTSTKLVRVDVLQSGGSSKTPQQGSRMNTWSGYGSRLSHVTPQNSSSSHTAFASERTHTPGTANKRSVARREAELIHARGHISQLELELSKTQRAAKRARIESEEGERERKTTTVSQELQRLHALDKERQGLAESLAEVRQELGERDREEGEGRRKMETLVADSERKNREQREEVEEFRSKLSSLSNENSYLSRQLSVVRSERDAVRAGLEEQLCTQTAAVSALRRRVTELEGVERKWEMEQERVKELEHKLKQQKHDIQFAEMVQSKLLHCEDVERELRQLREENAALRSHTDNVSLMRYQLQTLQERVERSKDVERKAVRLEVENEALRERREESGEGRGSLGACSPGLQCTLTELQRREVVLLGQVGELESRLKLVQRSSDRAELAVTETRKQLAREQEECRLRGEKVQRLEKRLLFVSKERDGCVNVLNSYRLDSGVDAILRENLTEVEKQLGRAKERIAELESEVETLASRSAK